jgi:hypothetical protein
VLEILKRRQREKKKGEKKEKKEGMHLAAERMISIPLVSYGNDGSLQWPNLQEMNSTEIWEEVSDDGSDGEADNGESKIDSLKITRGTFFTIPGQYCSSQPSDSLNKSSLTENNDNPSTRDNRLVLDNTSSSSYYSSQGVVAKAKAMVSGILGRSKQKSLARGFHALVKKMWLKFRTAVDKEEKAKDKMVVQMQNAVEKVQDAVKKQMQDAVKKPVENSEVENSEVEPLAKEFMSEVRSVDDLDRLGLWTPMFAKDVAGCKMEIEAISITVL